METTTNAALTDAPAPRERNAANSHLWYAVGPDRPAAGGLWFQAYTADEMAEILDDADDDLRFLAHSDLARLIAATGLRADEIER